MSALTFKPRLIPSSALRTQWIGVLFNSAWTGPAGLRYQTDDKGTQLVEHRDGDGVLRGVLVLYGDGELLLMVDPKHQRRGIGTALLAEAARLGLAIRFEKQAYTRAGWATIRGFLASRNTEDREAA